MRARLLREIAELNPGYGAWVMATGIVSTGLHLAAVLDLAPSLGPGGGQWAFGTWWIPLLLVFAIWRHALFREHLRYDAVWWSMVFPLRMYAAASASYGQANGVDSWSTSPGALGFVAWLGVLAAMIGSFLPARRPGLHGRQTEVEGAR